MGTPKIDDQLADLLEFVKSGVEKSTEFAAEQAPLVAREIVAWTISEGVLEMVCFGIGGLLAIAIAVWLFRKVFYDNWDDSAAVPAVMLAIVSVIMAFAFASSAAQTVKGIFAPRLVIIDYIRHEVR